LKLLFCFFLLFKHPYPLESSSCVIMVRAKCPIPSLVAVVAAHRYFFPMNPLMRFRSAVPQTGFSFSIAFPCFPINVVASMIPLVPSPPLPPPPNTPKILSSPATSLICHPLLTPTITLMLAVVLPSSAFPSISDIGVIFRKPFPIRSSFTRIPYFLLVPRCLPP